MQSEPSDTSSLIWFSFFASNCFKPKKFASLICKKPNCCFVVFFFISILQKKIIFFRRLSNLCLWMAKIRSINWKLAAHYPCDNKSCVRNFPETNNFNKLKKSTLLLLRKFPHKKIIKINLVAMFFEDWFWFIQKFSILSFLVKVPTRLAKLNGVV